MKRRSESFEVFLAGVNEPVRLTRDSLDGYRGIGMLALLTGDERIEAEDILIGKLADNDGRAASALADAGCLRAIPALVERTRPSSPPSMRVYAARALLELGDNSGEAALVDVLRAHAGIMADRNLAVRTLARFPNPDKDFLLDVALTDPDSTVRSEAIAALLTAHGLGDEKIQWGEVLLRISGRLLSSLPSVREEALAELRAILARWEAGATVEELGLTWRLDGDAEPWRGLLESIGADVADYPVDGLADLTGRERAAMENLLLIRLDTDRQAVRAVARLGVRRAIQPLRELLDSATGDARAEIQAALDALG